MKLFNASKFVIDRFGDIDPALLGPDKVATEIDRAAIAELRPLIERATAAFDDFDYSQALSLTEDLFWSMFCDNYIEIAKPRTYDEELSAERLSAASSLRLIHRALVRMLSPFIPFIADEVWHWAYSADEGMHDSVHRSAWPSLEEFSSIAVPENTATWTSTVEVVEAVRKAKATQQVSVKAPVDVVEITHTQAFIDAIMPTVGDLMEMLQIETIDMVPDAAAKEIGVKVEFKEVENSST